jgi:prepilin-type processing-associated H-X9-DG protein
MLTERSDAAAALGVDWYTMIGDTSNLGLLHRRKANAVYCDGHVGAITRASEVGTGSEGMVYYTADSNSKAKGGWTTTARD